MKKNILIECLKTIPGNPEIAICENILSKKKMTVSVRTFTHFDVEYLEGKDTTDKKPLGLLTLLTTSKKIK